MKIPSWKIAALGLLLLGSSLAYAEPPASVQVEINYLLKDIGTSNCTFQRNGIWSDAKTAEGHVRGKYDFLLRLGLIKTTDDFIDKAATRSSLSGQPYQIKCGGDLPVHSGVWLHNELARYRASQK